MSPYVLYGVKFIDLVSLARVSSIHFKHTATALPVTHTLPWIMPPYVLYGVKYIDLLSLAPFPARHDGGVDGADGDAAVDSDGTDGADDDARQNGAKSGFEMCFGSNSLGAGAKTRLESSIKNL